MTQVIEAQQYRKIMFNHEMGLSCCGQLVLYDIAQMSPTKYCYNTRNQITNHTIGGLEDVMCKFVEDYMQAIEDDTDSYNPSEWDSGEEEKEERLDCCYGLVTMTIVDYAGNLPSGFRQWLVDNDGWRIVSEFTNPKTKNTVYHMDKYL